MNINKQLFTEVFQGLQKTFIVESVGFDFGSQPNGHYDVEAMVEGKIIPPDSALIADCSATVFERPWRTKGQYILSEQYRLNCRLSPGIGSKQIIAVMLQDYNRQKAEKKA